MQVLHGHTDAVRALAFAPDGRTLASVGQAARLRLWDLSRGELHTVVGDIGIDSNHAVAFSPDGSLVAATIGSRFQVRRLDDPQAVLFDLTFFSPRPVLFHPSGLYLAAGMDGRVWRWDVTTWERLPDWCDRNREGAWNRLTGMALSADGERLLVCHLPLTGRASERRFILSVCDARTGHRLAEHSFDGDAPEPLTATPDGRFFIGAQRTRIRAWDATTGEQVAEVKGGRQHFKGLAVSPDGRLLAAVNGEDVVRVWDTHTWGPSRTYRFDLEDLFSVAFAPDGSRAAVGGIGIVVWDLE